MLSAEEFIKAWQTSKNLKEVVEKTNASRDALRNRASLYRKRGVPLRRFKRGKRGPKLDVKELTNFALKYVPDGKK